MKVVCVARSWRVMADKNDEDKGKDPRTMHPFSEEQVAFLCTLLEERRESSQSGKGKEPAKKLTNETDEPGECVGERG